jgi:homoserine O-acetyltransferase/O-succinyltransferase
MNGETPMSAEPQRKPTLDSETIAAPGAASGWEKGVLDLPQPFRLESGEVLENARLAWQCAGPADAPLVIALGGISAHRGACSTDSKGWWEEQVGVGKTLDTQRYRVLGIDWLGGCDKSTGPRGEAHFPVVSTADQARALLLLLNRLGVRRVHLVVGASYGGNVAQHLAALLGERLRRLVLLSAAHRPAQFGLGLRHIQRAILDLGGESAEALALARALAVLCYRTTEGVEQRFADDASRDGQEPECPGGHGRPRRTDGVVGWLRHHGESFSRRFDTAAYRCLGRSLDGHQIDPATIRAPTTVFAVREDLTVPLSLLHEYAARAGRLCQLVEISSTHGHDAFLKEEAAVSRVLAAALEATP